MTNNIQSQETISLEEIWRDGKFDTKDVPGFKFLNDGKHFTRLEEGKINKYFEEVCLLNQEYIKDDKLKVENVLGDVKVEKFVRFSLN